MDELADFLLKRLPDVSAAHVITFFFSCGATFEIGRRPLVEVQRAQTV